MKKKHILLGKTDDGQEVHIDIATLIRTRAFMAASSGGGKSETMRHLLEELCGTMQCIVIDPEGEFSTLREKYPFVLVGEGGETPAHPHTAAQVALTLLKTGASAVCDLYELRGNKRHEFVANFINAIVEAPKELWHPVFIFIDEAQIFVPENGFGESVAKNPIIDLCNLGRKRGFCPILCSQRASKVSKNATEPLQNFFSGLTMPDDQQRVCGVFKIKPGADTRAFSTELENLEAGQFFVRGAAISKKLIKVTVQRAITKPPKTGSAAAAKRTPTPEAIRHLLPTMAEIPQEVEKKAKTESDLRAELATANRTIRDMKTAAPSMTEEALNMLKQKMEELAEGVGKVEAQINDYKIRFARLKKIVAELSDILSAEEVETAGMELLRPLEKDIRHALAKPIVAAPSASLRVAPFKSKPAADGEGLSGPEQRIVNALAWFHALGIQEPEQPAVAFMAGYTYGSGGYNNPRGRLNARGFVQYIPGDKLRLTEDGEAMAQAVDMPATNEALHAAVLSKLGGPEGRILTPLLKAYPKGIDNESLAAAANYAPNSGGYNNPRGRLKSLGLVRYESGTVIANDLLFPEGR